MAMSGGRAQVAAVAAMAFVLALAGCLGKGQPTSSSLTTTLVETSVPTTTNSTPPPPPQPVSPFEPGNEPPAQGGPRFTIPEVWPGRVWSKVEFAAQMPAGSWLFLYIPLPPGQEMASDDMPRRFRVAGEANATGPSAYVVFAPFLIQDDHDGQVRETFLADQVAAYNATGGAWEYEPFFQEVSPFGGTLYAGIAVFAAANTPWTMELNITAPWEGEGTVGPERVAWGQGFSATRLPAMSVGGPGGSTSTLDWKGTYAPGFLGVQAASACYNASPCTDAVVQEDWTFAFPDASLHPEFHRTSTSGTAPKGFFGTLDGPAGDLAIHGELQGLTGARTLDVYHAPLAHKSWPFPLTNATFRH